MEPGKTYHVFTHANGAENLFLSPENYRFFLRRYDHFIPPVADTLAYCLMPNHLHLLIEIKPETELTSSFGKFETFQKMEARISKQFANLFSSYTQAFNKMYHRRGSLFIPNFKRKEITSDSYYTRIIHYIHHNPVHHGFTNRIAAWPWTSYHDFLLPGLPPVRQKVLEWFGNREQFVALHGQSLGKTEMIEDD